MRKITKYDLLAGAIIMLFLFSGIYLIVIFPAQMEANTFNKYKNKSQPEATIIDALFSDLRVNSNE